MNALTRQKFFNATLTIHAIILLAWGFWIVTLQAAELTPALQPILKAKLTDTLIIGQTKQVSAEVIGAAVDGQVVGTVTVEPAGASQRVKISWNSLTTKERGTTTTIPFSKPLDSRFLVKGTTVTPGTTVTMAGEAAVVTNAAKQLADKIEQAGLAKAKQGIAAGNDPASAVRRSSDVGGGVSSTTPPNVAAAAKGPTADVLVPKIVACSDRIDKAAGYVFKQQKTDMVDPQGAAIKPGECADITPGYAIQKAYGGACTTLVDTINKVAYKGYREFATVDSKEVEVTTCTNETTAPFALTETSATCSVRADLTKGIAYQQTKYYYTDNSQQVDATACGDSATQYSIYQTTTTCSPIYDQANGLAFTQKRSGYDGAGGTAYVTECAPVSTTGVAVSAENCANPKYEHDFTTGVSYVLDRKYYMNGPSKVYLTSCARSALVSYNHKHNTTNCGVTNDDTLLKTMFKQNTYIATTDDGNVEIKPCEDGNQLAYVTLSAGWVATSNGLDRLWPPSNGHVLRGGCAWADYWTWDDKTRPIVVSGLTNVSYMYIGSWPAGQCDQSLGDAYIGATRGNYIKQSTFQRGDGSQYVRTEQTVINAIGP